MTVLEARIEALEKSRMRLHDFINEEFYKPDSVLNDERNLILELRKLIETKYKDKRMDIIDEELTKPVVHYMSADQVLRKFGDVLDDYQIQILKNLNS